MKNKKPDISVIMAVYNGERFLNEAIDSILNQTFTNFELIIINDCSTDGTASILSEYKKLDTRIIVLNNEKNIKQSKSRNRGLKIARGKYIAIMDADDVSFNTRLYEEFKYLESNPDIFIVGSLSNYIDDSGLFLKSALPLPYNNEDISKTLINNNCIIHPSVMFRNDHIVKYRLINAEDYDVYLNLLTLNKKFHNINAVLINYRINPKSITNNNIDEQIIFAEIAKKYYQERINTGKDSNSEGTDEIYNDIKCQVPLF